MDDNCGFAETLEWVAYGACGHKDVCSTCVARLRSICDDRRCCICKTEANVVFVTKALGDYTRMISDFSCCHLNQKKVEVVLIDGGRPAGDAMRKRARFRNIEQLKGHLFHQHKLLMCSLCLEGRKIFICEQKLYTRAQLNQHINTGDSEVDGTESERGGFTGHPLCEFLAGHFMGIMSCILICQLNIILVICARMRFMQHPGQYEYYKNYDDLEFVVFQSESELKRHNTLEHGGGTCRVPNAMLLAMPTSFRYRRNVE
ncbi:hypothetical protein HAX54_034839 [Datura stramonium]|uniref:Uncharacterized protein n=1 Tax=Datura stramonium TaxID=4076 RepID=A0ABS8SEP0_DATST|nr:hypothetical protein [Datura stramonium]